MKILGTSFKLFTRPKRKNKTIEQVKLKVTKLSEPLEKPVLCSSTNYAHQNVPKKPPREKFWTIPFLLEIPKSKEFQPPDLEIGFLRDSGEESNIIKFPLGIKSKFHFRN